MRYLLKAGSQLHLLIVFKIPGSRVEMRSSNWLAKQKKTRSANQTNVNSIKQLSYVETVITCLQSVAARSTCSENDSKKLWLIRKAAADTVINEHLLPWRGLKLIISEP